MTHANLSTLSESGLEYEIDEALVKFEKAVGQKATMFRCPYGACGTKGLARIAKHDMIHVFWNVDSLDWQDKDPNAICKRTIAQVEKLKRGIILFHDIHPQSAACVDKLLTYFRERVDKGDKLKLVTMKEAITELNGGVAFESP
jgi:peptidoglycan/xylan/chitin deacetylase (PgdA/CDA1 family)